MIDVKEAVKIAFDYLGQLYDPTTLHDKLLEEVALSDDEKYWYVTIGFSRPVPPPPEGPFSMRGEPFSPFSMRGKRQREYKIVQIDSQTGQVRSMKIRAA